MEEFDYSTFHIETPLSPDQVIRALDTVARDTVRATELHQFSRLPLSVRIAAPEFRVTLATPRHTDDLVAKGTVRAFEAGSMLEGTVHVSANVFAPAIGITALALAFTVAHLLFDSAPVHWSVWAAVVAYWFICWLKYDGLSDRQQRRAREMLAIIRRVLETYQQRDATAVRR